MYEVIVTYVDRGTESVIAKNANTASKIATMLLLAGPVSTQTDHFSPKNLRSKSFASAGLRDPYKRLFVEVRKLRESNSTTQHQQRNNERSGK